MLASAKCQRVDWRVPRVAAPRAARGVADLLGCGHPAARPSSCSNDMLAAGALFECMLAASACRGIWRSWAFAGPAYREPASTAPDLDAECEPGDGSFAPRDQHAHDGTHQKGEAASVERVDLSTSGFLR
jgi:hypothetical protein